MSEWLLDNKKYYFGNLTLVCDDCKEGENKDCFGKLYLVNAPKHHKEEYKDVEYIELGPVTREDVINVPSATIERLCTLKEMTQEQFEKSVCCYPDEVLPHLRNLTKATLKWKDSYLVINGIKTSTCTNNTYEAVRVLCKLTDKSNASKIVAELIYNQYKYICYS